MKFSNIFFFFFFVTSIVLFAQSEEDNGEAGEAWSKAYKELRLAVETGKAGNAVRSLFYYKEALKSFALVNSKYPDYKNDLVQYRLKSIRRAIFNKEKIIEASIESLDRDEILRVYRESRREVKILKKGYFAKEKDIKILRNTLKESRDSLAKSAENTSILAAVMHEKERLKSSLLKLQDEYALLQSKQGSSKDIISIKEYNELVAKFDKYKNTHQLKMEEIENLKGDNVFANNQVRQHLVTINTLKNEIKNGVAMQQAKNFLQAAENKILVLEKQLKKLTNDYEQSKKMLIDKMTEGNSVTKDELQAVKELLQKEFKKNDDLTKSIKKISEKRVQQVDKIAKLEKELSQRLPISSGDYLDEMKMMREKIAKQELARVELNQQLNSESNKRKFAEDESKRYRLKIKDLESMLKKEQTQVAGLQAEYDQYREQGKLWQRKASSYDELKSLLDSDKRKLVDLKEKLDKTELAYAKLLDEVKSGDAAAVVNDKKQIIALETAFKKEIDRLNREIGSKNSTLNNLRFLLGGNNINDLIINNQIRSNIMNIRLAISSISGSEIDREQSIKKLIDELSVIDKLISQSKGRRISINRALELKEEPITSDITKDVLVDSTSGVGNLDPAIKEELNKVITVEVDAALRRAATAEKAGDNELARVNYLKALKLDSDNTIALFRLANIAFKQENDLKAEDYLARLYKLEQNDLEMLKLYGYVMLRQGKNEMAVSLLLRAISLYEDQADIREFLAAGLQEIGWREVAIVEWEKAFELADKKASHIAFNLAAIYAEQESTHSLAKLWYKRSLALGGDRDPSIEEIINWKETDK